MNILVTGFNGFIGKNLISTLHNIADGKDKSFGVLEDITVLKYDLDTDKDLLELYCKNADFVFHLAGVNRPKEPGEFMEGNKGFSKHLLELLKKYNNCCPIMYASSIQAVLDNPYGESKREAEKLLEEYRKETGTQVYIYRFPNVFGKWCRPDYNSAVATFCNNIANNQPIIVHDSLRQMRLVYIDDVVAELVNALKGIPNMDTDSFCSVPVEYYFTLGEIAARIQHFHKCRRENIIPHMEKNSFDSKLYATYLSYLPPGEFAFHPQMHTDERGCFTELFRSPDRGQVSVNIINPGITKGNHWHHTKNEKFAVVSGKGLIQLRKIGMDANGAPYPTISYEVSGEELMIIDMIPGYTHNIKNLSETEKLVTVIWTNELYDPGKLDTYKEWV